MTTKKQTEKEAIESIKNTLNVAFSEHKNSEFLKTAKSILLRQIELINELENKK